MFRVYGSEIELIKNDFPSGIAWNGIPKKVKVLYVKGVIALW